MPTPPRIWTHRLSNRAASLRPPPVRCTPSSPAYLREDFRASSPGSPSRWSLSSSPRWRARHQGSRPPRSPRAPQAQRPSSPSRARRDQARDGDEGRCACGALGDRGGRDPGYLTRHRGDDDSDHRDGSPGELARKSSRRHAGDDGVHRSGSRRGDATRFDNLRVHIRSGICIVPDDPGPQPSKLLVRPAIQGDLLVTQSTTKAQQQQGGLGGPDFKASKSTRYCLDMAFTVLVTGAALVGIVVLVVLLVDVIRDSSTMLSLEFLTSFPSQIFPENGGIYPALVGSLWLLGLTALISVPLGLGAAVYLEEYAEDTRINRIIEINISNLAGVPSVIYGLLGLGIFVELLAPVTGGTSV